MMNTQTIHFIARRGHLSAIARRLDRYIRLTRLNRPIGIFLLSWPALWALWLAGQGRPPWDIVLVFVLGAIIMRSAGCAMNDYADRDFDPHVTRTCHRPLALGEVTPKEAMGVFLVLSLIAFILVLTLNRLTIALSSGAVLLTAIYPYMKRITHIPQLILGAAFGWAVPMAFAAITGTVPALAWWTFAAAVVWALIYDTQYAMVDRDDDLRIGVKSTAILFGRYDRMVIALLQLVMLGLLIHVGIQAQRGEFYFCGIIAAAGTSIYQQYLTWHRAPAACFTAFLNNNYFGMFVFIGLLLDYYLI
jgi:4-hydroxybenzoate polyprenyltransferase